MGEEAGSRRRAQWRGMGITAPIAIGAGIVALFFGAFGAWAAFAPLESAAVARGVISVETQRKTIQHLEGGIVSEIRVRDGDEVAAEDGDGLRDVAQRRVGLGGGEGAAGGVAGAADGVGGDDDGVEGERGIHGSGAPILLDRPDRDNRRLPAARAARVTTALCSSGWR